MGLFSSMPKKPMAPSVKPSVSSDHQDRHVLNQPGHGVITHREFGEISHKLEHKLGEKRAAEITDLLEENMHGGVLKERQLDRVIEKLEKNHHDDIRERDIDRLKDIADASL